MKTPAPRLRSALYVAAVLLLQILVSLPRLDLLFVEGRAHWTNDSAYQTLRALHSLDPAIASPWKVLGLAEYAYDDAGREVGLVHYAHHPVLAAALFRAYAAAAGFRERVPRSFSLIFSLGITVLLFSLLERELGDPELAAGLTLLYALLPLDYNYQDAWKHETVATFVVLLNLRLARGLDSGRGVRAAFLAAFFLLFQAEWAVYAVGAGLWLWLLLDRPPRDRRYLAWVLAAGAAGVALNVWILCRLGFDWTAMRAQAVYRMSAGMGGVPTGGWLRRQLDFAVMNFTAPGAALLAGLALRLALRPRRALESSLTAFGGIVLLAALAWIGVFRNLSWVHHYHQWHLGLALVLLLAGALRELRRRPGWGGARGRGAALALLLPLLAVSARGDGSLESLIHDGDFVSPEDVAALRARTERLVVSSTGAGGPRDWWISPNVELYADPHYKAWLTGVPRSRIRGGVVLTEDLKRVDPGSDLVVTLRNRRAAAETAAELEPFGVSGLALRAESPTFAFWAPVMSAPRRGRPR